MIPDLLVPLLVSLKVAAVATTLILPPGILLGWLLARRAMRGKAVLETMSALPLILPPTAVGYLLLRLLARDGPLGERTLPLSPQNVNFAASWNTLDPTPAGCIVSFCR